MDYTELFDYMYEQHGLLLLESEMQEICHIVKRIKEERT